MSAGRTSGAPTLADLQGRWQIVSWAQQYDDGRTTFPMGESLAGFIDYGAHGMACMITRTGRAPFRTGGQWNADAAEKAAAYDGFMAYFGAYSLDGAVITHHVQSSLFPNWEGGLQRRTAALKDGQMHLTARLEEGTPEARTSRLVWQRADNNKD